MKIKNKFSVKRELEKQITNIPLSKKRQIGEMLVERSKILLEAGLNEPGYTRLSETIHYKIEKGQLFIYSDNKIVGYLHEGTKEHIIRPKKPGGSLAFRAGEVVTRKSGEKVQFGETIFAKQVEHPGMKARPFIEEAIFLAKDEIARILSQ